jgi:hypothetical protein
MSLVFYLKTIGKNVDLSARITFQKTNWRSDRWICVNQDFCMKILKRTLPPIFLFSLLIRRNEALPHSYFPLSEAHVRLKLFFFFSFFFNRRGIASFGWRVVRPFNVNNGEAHNCAPHHFILFFYFISFISFYFFSFIFLLFLFLISFVILNSFFFRL